MTLSRARRYLRPWLDWFERRRLHRAYPELALIDETIAAARRAHRPIASLVKQRTAIMTDALRREMRHG